MLTRREVLKLGVAAALVAASALSWDIGVNGGHPAKVEGDEEEPPI